VPIRGLCVIQSRQSARAGNPSDQEQQSDRYVLIDEDTLQLPKNAQTFALEVCGDSGAFEGG
jgi:SOS-response transcriptional repressor LexA